ncbi:MAG: hypothetical protein IJ791_05095 [Lachnospiraceae bacterium]|nr:hypothetical protein [Lachnospiraceae bacterium]
MEMWKVPYAKETFDVKLNLMLLTKKWWVLLVSSVLGVLLVGGPYFIKHVVYAPAREYEMVLDFKIDYAENSAGEEYTYYNQSTWYQLLKDDVFTDKVLAYLQADNHVIADDASGSEVAPLTKDDVKDFMEGTLLSDTRIVTATVRTHNPELTAAVADALEKAFYDFGEETREIDEIHTWQKPEQATLVVRDVRLFRACMVGLVLFDFVTLLVMFCRAVLDDSIYVPATFEKRYQIPMVGWVKKVGDACRYSAEYLVLVKQYLKEDTLVVTMQEGIAGAAVIEEIQKQDIATCGYVELSREKEVTEKEAQKIREAKEILLVVKAANHNGRAIEWAIELCSKVGKEITVGVLVYD